MGHSAVDLSGVTLVSAELGVSGAVRLDRPVLDRRVRGVVAMARIRWVPGRWLRIPARGLAWDERSPQRGSRTRRPRTRVAGWTRTGETTATVL